MRLRRRSLRWLLLSLLALAARPGLAQNLLVNPGFDRDLGGWTAESHILPDPARGKVSATWTTTDATGSSASGGLSLHAENGLGGSAQISLSQCVAMSEGRLVSFGASFLTASQSSLGSGTSIDVAFFASSECNGTSLGSMSATSLVPTFFGTSSNGLWLPAESSILSSLGTRSMRVSVSAHASGIIANRYGSVDAVADNVFATAVPAVITKWILPAAAWVHGAEDSFWTTHFTLSNPGSTDAAVTLKWLGHNADGRAGPESAYVVLAGQSFVPDEGTWWTNHFEDWGAILVTSTSPALIVQGETWAEAPGGGTVGQMLAAVASVDFIGAAPKTLAPVRDDTSFRTNLVLSNATEAPLTAHVDLFAADGTLLGTRDVALPPLGATQIGSVGWSLAGTTVNPGRIAVSTHTPGGLIAAYASVIDNVTNDPRTLLPRDASGSTSSANLLVNSGFDRDLLGWDLRTYFSPPAYIGASATWVATDSLSGNSGSVRFQLHGVMQTVEQVLLSQCVAAVPGRRYTGGGMVRTDTQVQHGVVARLELFSSPGCAGNPVAPRPPDGYSLTPMPYTPNNSDGRWLPGSVSVVAGADAQSLRFSAGVDAATTSFYSLSSFDGLFDDAFLFEQTDPATTWILPSSAKVSGAAGSSWTTALTLANGGAVDAPVTLKLLGHDGDGRGGDEKSLLLQAGTTVVFPDVLGSLFGRTQDYGAILITSPSPALVVESETSTTAKGGGTVGQALPAFGPADFARASPRTLAPIRENASFRTNLVLANATEAPLVAHVALFAADGTLLGARDVDLPPLGMTQLNRVAAALGAATLDLGRISVSTPTPGGLVAAYASVIDNTTNDPRTILPR